MRRVRGRCSWLMALALPAPRPASPRVWAVNDGEKVERDDLAQPAAARATPPGTAATVRLFGARNEIVAFQVIVEADARGHRGARPPRCPSCASAAAGRASRYAAAGRRSVADTSAGPIQIFSVHYMNVTETTHADWAWKPGSPAAPRDTIGLEAGPARARERARGRGGFPSRVGPARSQAIWIEVYTGRATCPPGLYDGTLTVTADGRPRTRAGRAARSSTSRCPTRTACTRWSTTSPTSRSCTRAATSTPPTTASRTATASSWSTPTTRRAVRGARRPLRRRATSRAARGYEGPGEGVGNTHRAACPSTARPQAATSARSAWTRADAWMTFLAPRAPEAHDVPLHARRAAAAAVPSTSARLAENVHSNPGPGRRLPRLRDQARSSRSSTRPSTSGARRRSAFDIARASERSAPGPLVSGSTTAGARTAGADRHRRAGHRGARHGLGRLQARRRRLLLLARRATGSTTARSRASASQNVWANPITFDNRGQPNKPIDDQGYINGDGVLLYPGEEKLHPDEDRGIAGPVATVQLANLRRGLQDHQYLTLARQLGLDGGGGRGAAPRWCRASSRTRRRRWASPRRATTFEAARLDLAEAIVAARTGRHAMSATLACAVPAPRPAPRRGGRARRPRVPACCSPSATRSPACPRSRRAAPAGARPSTTSPGWALAYAPDRATSRFARQARRELRADSPDRQGRLEPATWRYLSRVAGLRLALRLSRLRRGAQGPRGRRPRGRRAARCWRSSRSPIPSQASYHNHTAARAGARRLRAGRGRGARRRSRPGRRRCASRRGARLDNILEHDRPREPGRRLPRVDGLHADHLGAAGADGRAAADDDGRRSRAAASASSATWARRTSTRSCPTASTARDDDNEFRTSTPWTTWCSATRSIASRTPSRPGSCRRAAGCPRRGAIPCSSSCGATTRSRRAIRAATTERELPRRAAVPRHRPP